MGPRTFTRAEVKRAVELYEGGARIVDVARHLRTGRQAASELLHDAGVRMRCRGGRAFSAEANRARQLQDELRRHVWDVVILPGWHGNN